MRLDGSEVTFLAEAHGTNSPLPGMGNEIAWSPDSKQIAFVSSTPGPRAAEASGDPMVITRYLYKPDAGEGMTRFNDNQRLHIFVVDAATKQVRQLTQGDFDEHSVDWSPDGKKILFGSNREPNQDEFFNYDLFTLNVADGSIQRLTATEYNEYDRYLVPGRKMDCLSGHAAWNHRPRDHDGGHPRLGDECRRKQPPRNWSGGRQPARRATLVRG